MSTESKKSESIDKKKTVRKVKGQLSGPKGGIKPLKPLILFALIKMSGIGITEISGKLGGNVFSRTKGGAVIRNRVVPTNPQTVAQQAVRAIFGAISSAWRALTAEERESWNSSAQDYPYQNALGESKILSGKALFQKLNNNLLYAGQSILSSPLAPQGVNAPVTTSMFIIERNAAGTGFNVGDVEVDLATSGDNTTIVVLEMTPPLSPGVKNAAPRFVRVLQDTVSNSNVVLNFEVQYAAMFGIPAEGTQVQLRVFAVNPATGEKSAFLGDTTLVTQGL